MPVNDPEIVALYWQRDENAVLETARKYEAYLFRIAYNILANAEDSRECVNDTYLAAWNSMPEHKPDVLSVYLGKITRQIAIDRYRKKHAEKRYASEYAVSLSELEDCLASGALPEQAVEAKMLDEAVDAFLRSLPKQARMIFIGRYYFFDPVKTIASYCGVSEAKVKTSLFRTRRKLKEYLVKEGFAL